MSKYEQIAWTSAFGITVKHVLLEIIGLAIENLPQLIPNEHVQLL